MTAAIRIKVAIGLHDGENYHLGHYRRLSISAVKAILAYTQPHSYIAPQSELGITLSFVQCSCCNTIVVTFASPLDALK
jgi:hypothetical protein